jgi:hypothetical protein
MQLMNADEEEMRNQFITLNLIISKFISVYQRVSAVPSASAFIRVIRGFKFKPLHQVFTFTKQETALCPPTQEPKP